MQITISTRTLAALTFVAVFAVALVWHFYPASSVRTETTVLAPEVPVIMRTEGGLLSRPRRFTVITSSWPKSGASSYAARPA